MSDLKSNATVKENWTAIPRLDCNMWEYLKSKKRMHLSNLCTVGIFSLSQSFENFEPSSLLKKTVVENGMLKYTPTLLGGVGGA